MHINDNSNVYATLSQVAKDTSQLWISDHRGEDIGLEMKAIEYRSLKEAKDKLQI